MERYLTPEKLAVPELAEGVEFARADLTFLGVDHSGPSYLVRIFFNNPEAGLETPTEAEQGYAGSFAVFGHGACYGEEGHCDPSLGYRDIFDIRPPHPILPITRTVIVTEALRRLGGDGLEVTLVAVDCSEAHAKASDALAFEELRLLFYES